MNNEQICTVESLLKERFPRAHLGRKKALSDPDFEERLLFLAHVPPGLREVVKESSIIQVLVAGQLIVDFAQ